jgi:hypothetical protein
MSHYLIIRLEDRQMAKTLADSLITNYMWLNNYHIGNGGEVYYNASNVCEDISEVTLLTPTEEED